MINALELTRGIYGAYRLARFDPRGMTYFDISVDGFWKSFYAAALILPLYAILLAFQYQNPVLETHPLRFILVEGIGYSIHWTAFPVIMISLVRLFDRVGHYMRFIIAYNWAEVIQSFISLPFAIMIEMDLISREAGTVIWLMLISAFMFYVWFITRVALNITPGTAVGIVVFDFLLGIFVNGWVNSML